MIGRILTRLVSGAKGFWQKLCKAAAPFFQRPPRNSDLKWWAPRNRLGMTISILVILFIIAFRLGYTNLYLDARLDEPKRHEWVHQLYDVFMSSREYGATVESNLFGTNPDSVSGQGLVADLIGILTQSGEVLKGDKFREYIQVEPSRISPKNQSLRFRPPSDSLGTLLNGLEKLASQNHIRKENETLGAGAVYTLDLLFEVTFQDTTHGQYFERYNFRTRSWLEIVLMWSPLIPFLFLIIFSFRLDNVVYDWRRREYMRALARLLREAIEQLLFPLKLVDDAGEISRSIRGILARTLRKLIEIAKKRLDEWIKKADSEEARGLGNQLDHIMKDLEHLEAPPAASERDSRAIVEALQQLIKKVRDIQKRLLELSKENYQRAKAPFQREELEKDILEGNEVVAAAQVHINREARKINEKRKKKEEAYLKNLKQRKQEIVTSIKKRLLGKDVMYDIQHNLGTHDEEPSFKNSEAYTEDRFQLKGSARSYVIKSFSLPVRIPVSGASAPVSLTVRQKKRNITIVQTEESEENRNVLGKTKIEATNNDDQPADVELDVSLTDEPVKRKRNGEFSLSVKHISLDSPNPDPVKWFEKYGESREPKKVKFDPYCELKRIFRRSGKKDDL